MIYGVEYLVAKNLRQRVKALMNIAHADDRELLEKTAMSGLKYFSSTIFFK